MKLARVVIAASALAMPLATRADSLRPGIDVSVNGAKVGNASKINIAATGATSSKSGSSVTVTIPAGSSDGPLVQNSTGTLTVQGNPVDASTARAVVVNANTTLANTSARLLDIRNNGTTKLYVDPTGTLFFPNIAVLKPAIVIPQLSKFCLQDQYGNDCNNYLIWGSDEVQLTMSSHFSFSMDAQYFIENGKSTAIRFNNTMGVRIQPQSALQTCGSTAVAAGTILPIVGSGGVEQKMCVCSYNGTAYKWINLFNPSDRTGTTTTCPAS